ncbi:MAG: acyl-CoA thioesterase [Chitinophagaceae bacterium]|nr:MAG: acyl-CoA thioesterase [Chitinophagaceae bacterium]
MKGKYTSASKVTKTEVVCPNDTNPVGILKGGVLVQWMDIAAAVTSQTHSEKICVTASIDKVNFHAPARNGDIIIIESNVTRAFTTSIEIYTEAFRKKIENGSLEKVASAYFTFVALDAEGRPAAVPTLIPTNEEESLRYEQALQRKNNK